MIKKFWHVGVSAKDLEKTIHEYEKLGFVLAERFDKPEPEAHVAQMDHPSGVGVEIWQWVDENHPQTEYIKDHVAFVSDDLDKDVEEFVADGCKIVIPRTQGIKVEYVFVKDPNGKYLEIVQEKQV